MSNAGIKKKIETAPSAQPFRFWDMVNIDLEVDEGRAAYVGPKFDYYKINFDIFDAANDFQATVAWPAFIFGWLWFWYRKMHLEAMLFMTLWLYTNSISTNLPMDFLGLLGVNTVGAFLGNWLYWKSVDRKVERAMRVADGGKPWAIAWLKIHGGVNLKSTILAFLLVVAFWVFNIIYIRDFNPDRFFVLFRLN